MSVVKWTNASDLKATVRLGGLMTAHAGSGLLAAGLSVDVDGFNTVSDFVRLGSKVLTGGNGYKIRPQVLTTYRACQCRSS